MQNDENMTNGKALIIEDELMIRNFLCKIVSSLGFDAIQAGTLNEGVDQYKDSKPDVVFLDLNLPDGSGFDIISSLKAKNPDVKVIIVSGRNFTEERNRASLEGADFFVGKPFNKDAIKESLEAVYYTN